MKLFKIEFRKLGKVLETKYKFYASADDAKRASYLHAEKIGTGINVVRVF